MSVQSPFKFLDSYDKEDKDIFFGRDEEVEQLYELVFQSNLTLVYGQSGTGKTSLVQCGLANRFAVSDWFNVYIRRNDDINASLQRTLRRYDVAEPEKGTLRERLRRRHSVSSRQQEDRDAERPVSETVKILRRVYKRYMKPVYLIFDQFEELFILGGEAEQAQFYQNIADIIETEPYCKVLIIMREESIAQLYDFERVVPILFEKRLRVEPMSRPKAVEVITKTTENFGIGLQDEEVPGHIIDAVNAGQGRVELTYLQVFLDRLFQEAALRRSNEIVFNQKLVEDCGSIEDVLAAFLDDQSAAIQLELKDKYPHAPGTGVRKLLNTFVTLEGTKRPQPKEDIQVAGLNKEQTGMVLDRLEKARILRFEDGLYELSHDTLALRVAGQRSEEEIALLQIVKLVRDRRQAYDATKTLLNNNELALIRANRQKLEEEDVLKPEEWQFIQRSIRSNRIRRLAIASTVLVVMIILGVAAIYSYGQSQLARESAREARESEQLANQALQDLRIEQARQDSIRYEQYLAQGKVFMEQAGYTQAAQQFETALVFNENGTDARRLLQEANSRSGVSDRFKRLIAEGDAFYGRGEAYYVDARDRYRQAFSLNYNNSQAQSKLDLVEGNLGAAYDNLVREGDIFFRAQSYRLALEKYRAAERIKPDDADLKTKIRQTETRTGG